MFLNSLCNSTVYHLNAYYILGVSVKSVGRKLRRRIEDFQNAAEMGVTEWQRSFDPFLLGSQEIPTHEQFNNIIERMKDPEFVVTEAFFWFWPMCNDSVDPAIEAICSGDRARAYNIWRLASSKSTLESVIARHNLAILFQFYAIDAENQYILETKKNDKSSYLKILDQYWRISFEYWEALVEDDDFWDIFLQYVEQIDDPRLDAAFVEEFRQQFPVSFDNINADYLIRYIQKGWMDDAKRHLTYMRETMSASDDVDVTLGLAFKSQIDKVNVCLNHCRENKNASEGLKDVRAVLEVSKDLFNVFQLLLPPSNRVAQGLMNDVANVCHDRVVAYVNKTGDDEGSLVLEQQLLPLAKTSSLKNKIQKAIDQISKNIQFRREANTCWYCKTYQQPMPKKQVDFYGNVLPDILQFGRVKFSKIHLDVPVCSNCSNKFSERTIQTYPPVDKLLKNGWKIGDGPTDAEIDEVWLAVAGALKGVMGNNYGRRYY